MAPINPTIDKIRRNTPHTMIPDTIENDVTTDAAFQYAATPININDTN